MAQAANQGNRAMKPSPNYVAPPEAAEPGTIYVPELPEMPAMAFAKLPFAGGDWFHRAQRESIGMGPRTSDVESRD